MMAMLENGAKFIYVLETKTKQYLNNIFLNLTLFLVSINCVLFGTRVWFDIPFYGTFLKQWNE